MKETPFSLKISLNERLTNHWNHSFENPPQEYLQWSHQEHPERLFGSIKTTGYDKLLNKIQTLKSSQENASVENETISKELKQVEKAHIKLQKDYRAIQIKHEKVCADLKNNKF